MALGIELRSSTPDRTAADPLGAVELLIGKQIPEAWLSRLTDSHGHPALFAKIHPAAQDVRISLEESGLIVVSANTSSAGPGYHACLVEEVLDPLSSMLGTRWEPLPDGAGDETGFFETRDHDRLEGEMLRWIGTVARHVTRPELCEYTSLQIGMDSEHAFTFPSFSLTALGPRDRGFWQDAARNPRSALGFFAWWEPGRGAQYWLNRALAMMWTEVRWSRPAQDSERRTLEAVRDALATAHKMDARLPWPWQEWDEVLMLLESQDERVHLQALPDPSLPPIGYRRHPVRVSLPGGWSLLVPGSMHERWEDEGKTYSAWDDQRTVWFSSLAFSGKRPKSLEDLRRDRKPGALETFWSDEGGRAGVAELRTVVEDGEQMLRLGCETWASGKVSLMNIYFEDRADLEWAVETWRSLRAPRAA